MRAGDVKQCQKLLAKYLERFDLAPTFTDAEFEHWFLPREGVVYTYVVANPSQGGKITDMVSFYALPSSVIKVDKHKDIKAAYLFYYAYTATPLKDLLEDMIVMAGKVRLAHKAGRLHSWKWSKRTLVFLPNPRDSAVWPL